MLLIAWINWKAGLLILPFVLVHVVKAHERALDKPGYIYFIADESIGLVKIGRTKYDPRFRLARLAGQSPNPLHLLAYYHSEDAAKEEHDLHVALDDCREHGEWFDYGCVKGMLDERGDVSWPQLP